MPPTKEVKQYYYSEIERLNQHFAIDWLCQLFGVSRSGYYKWKHRKGNLNRYEETQRILDGYIAALHKAHPSSGYRALNGRLRSETGWIVSNISVLRSMQRLSIQARVWKSRNATTEGEEHTKYPNVLNREFSAERPLAETAENSV